MNKRVLDDSLVYEILSVMEEVPEGKVATYGQIARLIGRSKKCPLGGLGAAQCGALRQLSVPPHS